MSSHWVKTHKCLFAVFVAIFFLVVTISWLAHYGGTYTYTLRQLPQGATLGGLEYDVEDDNIIRVSQVSHIGDTITVTIIPVAEGSTYFSYSYGEQSFIDKVYVHPLGIITSGGYFGNATGSWLLPVLALVFTLLILYLLIDSYRAGYRQNIYSYRNILLLSLIIFIAGGIPFQVLAISGAYSLIDAVEFISDSFHLFSFIALPIAFVTFIFVTISNFILVKKEGFTWRNFLGLILGVALCALTIVPTLLGDMLQNSTIVDVHNEQGIAMHIEYAVDTLIYIIVSYLETVLLSTIILSVKAARHIPAFDKDYILILGCKVLPDGSLSNILRARADRAIYFRDLQYQETGKDLFFVPSGGRGQDEPCSEAEAISQYLVSRGIHADRILPETKSKNTLQNLKFSYRLIKKLNPAAKLAFSTTNYHVFRAGNFAAKLGISAEGIGAETKAYFWLNAFIREFVAALVAERRTHLRVISTLVLLVLLSTLLIYLSNTVLL